MIVIVGSPIGRPADHGIGATGIAVDVARAAAESGAAVEVVGRVGEDGTGDAILLDLAAHEIGHVAMLREPGRPTPTVAPARAGSAIPDGPALAEAVLDGIDPLDDDDERSGDVDEAGSLPAGLSLDAGDLELALRYIPDYRVLVVAADLDGTSLDTVIAAASWSGAHLVALVPDGSPPPAALPAEATVLLRPATDPDGAFAAMVAGYAVALDRGDEPRAAFAAAQRAGGWAAVAD